MTVGWMKYPLESSPGTRDQYCSQYFKQVGHTVSTNNNFASRVFRFLDVAKDLVVCWPSADRKSKYEAPYEDERDRHNRAEEVVEFVRPADLNLADLADELIAEAILRVPERFRDVQTRESGALLSCHNIKLIS